MIKPECQPTPCFLYSPADSEIIHVNYDSCPSLSSPSARLPSSFFPFIHPFLPNPSLSHSLCSAALYHSVSVTVTVRAFGVPCRHSHVAAADMRMWPWLAAPWRATREHFKGCLTAGWEARRSPQGPRTSGFSCGLHSAACTGVATRARNLMRRRATSATCRWENTPGTYTLVTHDKEGALWSWPHVENNSVSYRVSAASQGFEEKRKSQTFLKI